jgi:hypothetical protein
VESAASIRYLPPRTRLDALHKSCAPIFKGDGSCLMKCLRKGVCSRAILSRQAQGAACRFDFAPYKHASTASKIRPPDCIMRGWTACNYVKRQLRNSTVNPWSPAPTPNNNRLRILSDQPVASNASSLDPGPPGIAVAGFSASEPPCQTAAPSVPHIALVSITLSSRWPAAACDWGC